MKLVDKLLCLFGLLLLFSFRALAHDPSMAHHEWFNKQEMTPERGRTRLYAWHSIPKPRVLRLLYQMKPRYWAGLEVDGFPSGTSTSFLKKVRMRSRCEAAMS
jgi:hypothetical protein